MEYGQSQLAFEFSPKPPRLLPPAVEPSSNPKDRDPPRELFFLESIDIDEELQEPRIPPDETPTTAEDPATGVEFEWFDKHNYELSRFIKKYPPRVPHLLKRNIPPLRPPEAIKPHEKIMGLEQIPAAQLSPANITYICLYDVAMPKKQAKDFHKALAPFVNVEVLILRGLGLNNLKNCKYPNLRFLDLSNNQFDKIANIVALVKNSPNLEVANLLYNPCAPREDLVGRMLAVCPYLVTVNEKDLTVGERIHALEAHGPKSMKAELPLLRWDMALDLIPEITQMRYSSKGWDPQAIVVISLPNCGLTNLAVSSMVNLQTLDLSNNQLSDLRNTGIEQCQALAWINLKFNQISKMNTNFAVLAQVSPLRSVTLEGNPCALKKDYRSRLIFATRTLRGTNRSPGLQELDGAAVTTEERIAAVDAFGSTSESPNEGNAEVVRWNLNLIAKYGHAQVRGGFLGKAISCSLPNKNLGYANVAAFVALQYLDLSANHLSDIPGLENLEMLRMLDISENPRLKTKKVLKQLQKYANLESFSFFVSAPDHKRVIKSRSYRDIILRTILASNRMLKFVDGIAITREERIETYGFGIPPEEMEAYRFNLALTLNCCSSITSGGEAQRLHPSDVAIGAQYDPASITGLRRLTRYGITSRVCDFSAFVNLVELDISHNKLTDVVSIGLQGHRNLRVFCATHNAITSPLSKIAAMLDSIPHLEIVCLRDNPIMRTTEDRMKLLGYMHSQRVFLPVLRVLDTEITLDERIDAWKKACAGEINDDEPERLRFAVVIQSVLLNQPLVPQQTALTSLDLSHADLAFVNVAQFVHLRELNLLGNRIESLDSCVGISQLKLLEVLDLRFNLLSRLEAIAALVAQLPLLETLGLLGNKCAPASTAMASLRDLHALVATNTPSYRVRFLSMLPDALRVRGHSLTVLDSKEITIEERAQACKPDAASMALLKESLPNLQQQQQQDRIDKRASTLSLSSIEQVAGQVANFLTMRKGSTGSSTNSLVDTKVMCWPMALLRRLPPTIPYVAITEADFSNCSLSLLDLSILPSLVKLSLANNSIREQQFDRSNIATLADLRFLDIRSNQLKNLGLVCETVSRIPRLESLWLDGNPCYPAENASLRVRFFKKMRRGDLLMRLLNGNPVMPPDLVKLGMSKQKAQSMEDG